MKKKIGFVLGIVIGIAVAYMSPPQGLTIKAMWALGIFTGGIIYLVFDVFPDYIVTLAMCSLWVLFDTVPFNKAFSFFSNANWWVLVGAFGIGLAASKSGLLRRISLLIMRIFPSTFTGQVLAMLGAGTIIAPLIPSFTAKAAICSPLSAGISDAMGYERKSRGAAGLFGANVLGFIATAPGFLSASYLGFMLVSLLPKEVQPQFDWMGWFTMFLPWTIILLVLGFFAIMVLYKPKEKDSLPAGYAADQLKNMGSMSRIEKITALVIAVTLLLWMTEKMHGVSAAVSAILAVVVLIAAKVYDRADFRSGIAWDAALFVGTIVGIASVFPALGIDKWLGTVLKPYVAPLAGNPYLFVAGFSIIIYLIRFVLISQTAAIAIFVVMLAPLAAQTGINPWIVGIVVYAAGNTWTVFYQNAPYIAAFYATGGDLVDHSQMVKLSVAYMIISLIGFMACIPFWQVMGLVK